MEATIVQSMRIIKTTATEWGVLAQVRELLCKAGAGSLPGQGPGKRDAGGYRQISSEPRTGCSAGVSRAGIDETPIRELDGILALETLTEAL